MLAQEAKLVVVPGADGDFGVLAQHSPLVSTIRPGVMKIYKDGLNAGVSSSVFVSGGFAEITGDSCTILAEEAIMVDEIDTATADKRLSTANAAVDAATSEGETKSAQRELAIAHAMVKAVSN